MGRSHLTDDERFRVRVLRHDANFTIPRIAEITGYGNRQIRNALKSPTVAKRSGRPATLNPAREAELVRFVTASKENRSMSYANIAKALFEGEHGEFTVRSTLRRLGFQRSGPMLKQVVKDGEKSRVEDGPAGVAPVEITTAAATADAAATEGPMEDVRSTGPAAPRREDSATEDESMTEDESPSEGQGTAESQAVVEVQDRRGSRAPTEERVTAPASAAINATVETPDEAPKTAQTEGDDRR